MPKAESLFASALRFWRSFKERRDNVNIYSIGENIRKRRQEKKLRQEDLAELCNLSANYIGMIERGEKLPSLETFIDIVNALEVSADEILCGAVKTGYTVKESKLASRLENVSAEDKARIYDVVETMLRHSKKKK